MVDESGIPVDEASADDTWRVAETEPPPAMTQEDVPRETVDAGLPADSRVTKAREAIDLFCAQHPTLAPLVAEIRKALA